MASVASWGRVRGGQRRSPPVQVAPCTRLPGGWGWAARCPLQVGQFNDKTYYDVVIRIRSYADANPLAATPQAQVGLLLKRCPCLSLRQCGSSSL